jgi:type IV pilus assembly protein PilY1
MPSQALEEARQLAEPNYAHRYYVDGAPVENDVFFQGDSKRHSVLVGGLGLGGHGLYALNVTNPDLTGKPDPEFEEANANNLVLWEFTDADDADLGYTVGQPAIVRLHNGKWGVLVSNGYNSSEADGAQSPDDDSDGVPDSPAVLFVLDVESGAVMAKLDTGAGAANDPLGLDRPNGLAAVFPVDKDGDLITDYAYAGDLYGNVWRFDLIDTNASNWHVADFDGDPTLTGSPTPLFTAVDASGNPQSITTQVQVNKHPNGLSHGVTIFFGTGKYLENGDSAPNTTTTQTFYSIWDKSFFGVGTSINVLGGLSTEKKHGFVRNELQQQQINAEESASGSTYRRVTENPVTWSSGGSGSHGWYLDLKVAGGSNEGEMLIADPVVRGDAVVFTTLIPSQNPCVAGGTGFLMVLDQATGGRLKTTAFDVNNDSKFDTSDYLSFGDSGKEAASGIDVTGGTPGFILAGGKDLAVIPEFDGSVSEEELDLGIPVKGRKTWRQLR